MKIDTDAVTMAPGTHLGSLKRGFEMHADKFQNPQTAKRAPATGRQFGREGYGTDFSNSFERGIGTSKL